MRVGAQGLFRPYLKTFVLPSLPTRRTDCPWVSEDDFAIKLSHFVINLKWIVGGQVKPITRIIIDNNNNDNNNNDNNNNNNNNNNNIIGDELLLNFGAKFQLLYHYMRNFCNLIGLEQWYFSLILKYLHVKITNLLWVVV